MKKKSCLWMILFAMMVLLLPAGKAEAASVKMSRKSAVIAMRERISLEVRGTKKKVSWKSSNPSVAYVKGGRVLGRKEGRATITAKAGKKRVTCRIRVKGNYKKLYKAFLEKGVFRYKGKYSSGKKFVATGDILSFCVLDIDRNGVPDLVCKDSTADMGFGIRHIIYTVKDGRVAFSGVYALHRDPDLYYNRQYKSLYNSWWSNYGGGTGQQLYRMSGKKIIPYKYLWEANGSSGAREYYYGKDGEKNKRVSYKKYKAVNKKYFKKPVKYTFRNNDSWNRDAVFGN